MKDSNSVIKIELAFLLLADQRRYKTFKESFTITPGRTVPPGNILDAVKLPMANISSLYSGYGSSPFRTNFLLKSTCPVYPVRYDKFSDSDLKIVCLAY